MSEKYHRIHVRMSQKQYDSLRQKSKATGMAMNRYLMKELLENTPAPFPARETAELIEHLNIIGREINTIARDFNMGCGNARQLRHAVELVGEAVQHVDDVRRIMEKLRSLYGGKNSATMEAVAECKPVEEDLLDWMARSQPTKSATKRTVGWNGNSHKQQRRFMQDFTFSAALVRSRLRWRAFEPHQR